MSTVSILGDSISTYEGYNPDGYEVYYDEFMQARSRLTDVNDTWWAMTMHHFGWDLCVNNSYSGCKVSGKAFPAASSEARLLNLKTDDSQPDFILIYIGFNDFGYGVEIGKKNLELIPKLAKVWYNHKKTVKDARQWKKNEMENRGQYPTNFGKKSRIRYRRPKDAILNGNIRIDLDRVERDWILERCYRVSSTFCGLVVNGKRFRQNLAQEVVSTGTFRSGKRQAFFGRYGR